MRPRWLAGLGERARALFAPASFEAELDEEIRYHIDAATERNILLGMTPEEARAAALCVFGSIDKTKAQVRSASGVQPIQHLLQDQKHAVGAVRRQPRSAVLVAGMLAICLGAWGGAFAMLDSVLLKPAPFAEPDRLVSIFNSYPGVGILRAGNSVPDFYDRRRFVASLEDVALYTRTTYALSGVGDGQRVRALSATPSLLSVLNVVPALGHGLSAHLPDTSQRREVLISHGLWDSLFRRSRTILGEKVILEGHPFTVVGVLPPSFRFSEWDPQLLTRLTFLPKQVSDAGRHRDWYEMVGRLGPGATAESAAAEIELLNRAQLARYPADLRAEMTRAGFRTAVVPYIPDMTREARTPLLSIGLGALALLLIGAAAVVTVFVRRTGSRRESGEGLARFRRRAMTESTLLAIVGGLVGLAVAACSLWLFSSASPPTMPRLQDIAMDGPVIASYAAIAVAIGLAAGVASVTAYLRRAGRREEEHQSRGATSGRVFRLQSPLIASQIALSIALVTGAAVITADARSTSGIEPGFDASRLVTATISLPDSRYASEGRKLAFTKRMIGTLERLPSVESIAIADQPPFSGGAQPVHIRTEAPHPGGSAPTVANQTIVSESYFEALSIDLVEGRSFLASDDRERARVAVVDEVLARRYWADGNVIGQRFWRGRPGDSISQEKAIEVIGVVEAVKQNDLTTESAGAFYVPVAQAPLGYFRLMIRLRAGAEESWPQVRAAIASLDPNLVVTPPASVQEVVTASLGLERLAGRWLSAFGILGLLLSVVGVWCAIPRPGNAGAEAHAESVSI